MYAFMYAVVAPAGEQPGRRRPPHRRDRRWSSSPSARPAPRGGWVAGGTARAWSRSTPSCDDTSPAPDPAPPPASGPLACGWTRPEATTGARRRQRSGTRHTSIVPRSPTREHLERPAEVVGASPGVAQAALARTSAAGRRRRRRPRSSSSVAAHDDLDLGAVGERVAGDVGHRLPQHGQQLGAQRGRARRCRPARRCARPGVKPSTGTYSRTSLRTRRAGSRRVGPGARRSCRGSP